MTDSLSSFLLTDAAAEDITPEGAAPPEQIDPGVDAAGALYVPLGPAGSDWILWLRGEYSSTVRWAGAPDGHDSSDRNDRLTPRTSFAEWRESTRGRSRPWQSAEITTATEFADAMPQLLLYRVQNRLVQMTSGSTLEADSDE